MAHTDASGSFFGALGFTSPVEVLSLKTVTTANLLAWLIKPMEPHLIEAIPEDHPCMALAVLWTPETLHDAEASKVGVGLVYKAPYIQMTSFCKAYRGGPESTTTWPPVFMRL